MTRIEGVVQGGGGRGQENNAPVWKLQILFTAKSAMKKLHDAISSLLE